MEKVTIAAASCYNEKYYFNEAFNGLPNEVKNELKEAVIILSKKLHCIFSIGIYSDGLVFLETSANESDFNYDDIGAGLEIKRLEKEMKETFEGIEMWYKIANNIEG